MLEENESDIEDWFFNHQGEISLKRYLCSERILKDVDDSCLDETLEREEKEDKRRKNEEEESKRKNRKGDSGKKDEL